VITQVVAVLRSAQQTRAEKSKTDGQQLPSRQQQADLPLLTKFESKDLEHSNVLGRSKTQDAVLINHCRTSLDAKLNDILLAQSFSASLKRVYEEISSSRNTISKHDIDGEISVPSDVGCGKMGRIVLSAENRMSFTSQHQGKLANKSRSTNMANIWQECLLELRHNYELALEERKLVENDKKPMLNYIGVDPLLKITMDSTSRTVTNEYERPPPEKSYRDNKLFYLASVAALTDKDVSYRNSWTRACDVESDEVESTQKSSVEIVQDSIVGSSAPRIQELGEMERKSNHMRHSIESRIPLRKRLRQL
jgi:hypothetical protein